MQPKRVPYQQNIQMSKLQYEPFLVTKSSLLSQTIELLHLQFLTSPLALLFHVSKKILPYHNSQFFTRHQDPVCAHKDEKGKTVRIYLGKRRLKNKK